MNRLPQQFERMPGAEIVSSGLRDLSDGRITASTLAVGMAAQRLRAAGIDVPPPEVERPSHQLYELLASENGRGAHSRYNAIVRRIASFARAAERGSAASDRDPRGDARPR